MPEKSEIEARLAELENKYPGQEPFYGQQLVGIWVCPNQHATFPLPLWKENPEWLGKGWKCSQCGEQMTYDEEA